MSASHSSTENRQQSTTDVQNLNLQDTEGVTIANSSGVSVTSSDYGAIDRAADISSDAIDLGRRAIDANNDVSYAAITSAASSAEHASDRVERFAGDALAQNSNLIGDALDFAAGLFDQATGSVQKAVDTNISGLQSLAKQTSSSADDRVTKVAMYAFLALGAAFVLPAILGKLK